MLFNKFLKRSLTKKNLKVVKLFEISQFIRMLPFKLQVNKKSMIKFTMVASLLFEKYLDEYR